jgi:hypothetical protein
MMIINLTAQQRRCNINMLYREISIIGNWSPPPTPDLTTFPKFGTVVGKVRIDIHVLICKHRRTLSVYNILNNCFIYIQMRVQYV